MGKDGMMEYDSFSNPIWVDASHKMISVEVIFPSLGTQPVKFNASPDDGMDYGRQMYAEIIAGKYGSIAEPSVG